MAAKKETKAQRIAREEKEANERLEKSKAEYMPRLILALVRATAKDWNIRFYPGLAVVNIEYSVDVFECNSSLIVKDNKYLDDSELILLECCLDADDEKIKATKVKEQLRQSGLAKLTEEERKALGH